MAPAPTWRFRTSHGTLEKTVAMVQGRNLTVVRYELVHGAGEAELEVRVMLCGRDYHSVLRANERINLQVRRMPGMLFVPLYDGIPSVWIGHQASSFAPERTWYFDYDYPRERERGLED